MVCITGEKPVPFTDKAYKTVLCMRKYFCSVDLIQVECLYCHIMTLYICSAVNQANQAVVAISSSKRMLIHKGFRIPKEFQIPKMYQLYIPLLDTSHLLPKKSAKQCLLNNIMNEKYSFRGPKPFTLLLHHIEP